MLFLMNNAEQNKKENTSNSSSGQIEISNILGSVYCKANFLNGI